jgi:hypothetical protein
MFKLNEGRLDRIVCMGFGIISCRLCFADKPFSINRYRGCMIYSN